MLMFYDYPDKRKGRLQLGLMRFCGIHATPQQPGLTFPLQFPIPLSHPHHSKNLRSIKCKRKDLRSYMAFRRVILLILLSLPASLASSDEKLSAYQALQQYDFPAGILPEGVVGYELDRGTGEFSAYLNGSCNFAIDSYQLSYKSTIQGVISPGRIRNLKGVSVKVLFFWLNIVEVIHDGQEMEFSVGIASAVFPTDNFLESPQCGCGFNCNQFSALVSSI